MFEIDSNKYLIELDGAFHFCDNPKSGMHIEDALLRDKYKDRIANENGYNVIRIDCNYANLSEKV